MSIIHSKRLENFRNGFLNANSWEKRKDGPPLYLLDALTESEKKIAAKELCDAAIPGDSWHIIGIGYLRSEESLPKLYSLLTKGGHGFRVAVAHSIFLTNKDPAMIRFTLDETAKIDSQTELIDVIYLLPAFGNEDVNAMLDNLRYHPEYLVAYNATRALGLPTDDVIHKFRSTKLKTDSPGDKETVSRESWWKNIFGS